MKEIGHLITTKKNKEFITLQDACERFCVNMEVFSAEPECCFAEHIKYENGDFSREITGCTEEFNEITGEYVLKGGFVCEFDLKTP